VADGGRGGVDGVVVDLRVGADSGDGAGAVGVVSVAGAGFGEGVGGAVCGSAGVFVSRRIFDRAGDAALESAPAGGDQFGGGDGHAAQSDRGGVLAGGGVGQHVGEQQGDGVDDAADRDVGGVVDEGERGRGS